jgi:ribosomal protein L32
MAVPKKKTSKSKRNSRNSNWKKSIEKKVIYVISLNKSKNADLEKSNS